MQSRTENEFGTIIIDREVIAMVAGLAAMDCYGIVGMAAKDVKDGIVSLLRPDSLTKGVGLTVTEEGVAIDLHIIVEYGTNISAIADTLVSTVQYKVEDQTGLTVSKIMIYVEGVRVNKDY